jgi:murein DD-endopeptidase MepM/ murein hydrolase activator NlpD
MRAIAKFRWIFLVLMPLCFSVQAFAGLDLQGKAIQGGLIVGTTIPGTKVEHDGEPVRVSQTGLFVIGFGREAAGKSTLALTYPDGSRELRKLAIEQRQYNIQRIDGLPPSKVTPQEPEVLERIRKETAQVKQARKLDDRRMDFLDGFDWPLVGPITGVYGSQRVLNGIPKRPHYGVDVAAPVGTEVVAPADGLITLAHPDMYYSGGTLIIDHGHGVSSSFLHLHKVLVKEGDYVKRGQPVAQVGSKGRSSGPHLDWRINLFEKRLDPQVFAKPMQGDADPKVN